MIWKRGGLMWGEGSRQREGCSSYICVSWSRGRERSCSFLLDVLEEMISFWNRGLTRVPAAKVAHCRCPFLLQRAPGKIIKHCHKTICHMNNFHVFFIQMLFSTLAKLNWVVSHWPLYQLSLTELIWEEESQPNPEGIVMMKWSLFGWEIYSSN